MHELPLPSVPQLQEPFSQTWADIQLCPLVVLPPVVWPPLVAPSLVLPPSTGEKADKAFFDELSGDL